LIHTGEVEDEDENEEEDDDDDDDDLFWERDDRRMFDEGGVRR